MLAGSRCCPCCRQPENLCACGNSLIVLTGYCPPPRPGGASVAEAARDVSEERLVCRGLVKGSGGRASRPHFSRGASRAVPRCRRSAGGAGGSLLPPRGAVVARGGRRRPPSLRLSRPHLRRGREVRRGPRPGKRPLRRTCARLSGR